MKTFSEARNAALKEGLAAQSGVWYPIKDLHGFLPFELGSIESDRLFVRFADGRVIWWQPYSKTEGAVDWCVEREGWFEI